MSDGNATRTPPEAPSTSGVPNDEREPDAASGPTDPADRIVSLDALRGFALLGILPVNVVLFSMPQAALVNPTSFGEFSGWNAVAWLFTHILFELKFITLFTLMFGAGVVLFTASKERRGEPALRLYYRRTLLLLAIGLAHAYLLWAGDVLVLYALCGSVVVLARNWRPRRQLLAGVAIIAVPSAFYVLSGLAVETVPDELAAFWDPSRAAIDAEIAAYRGGWVDQMDQRVPQALQLHTSGLLFEYGWRIGGTMLVGMALFKWGVLSNERSDAFYWRVSIVGAVTGFALVGAGVWYKLDQAWAVREVLFFGTQFNYWGSLVVAAAYLAGVMLWCRRRPDGVLTSSLAAVGRTAFSNYLLQTVLATTIFYGHGLGLFGSVSRVEALGVVLAIWAVQIPLSVLWLRRYRFGPVEWVWRTLTYGERQPIVARDGP